MIIGTAGHIDHGKTTLTRALTGVDTDRLKEEKERGISIELGYAYTELESGEVLGIIDVPGHEKFIRTMASGVTGIDAALLVIAADDGIMPQTREHLAILQLLGVPSAVVALTKTDRAEPEQIAAVQAAIAALLGGTPYAGAPIFPTQAHQANDPGTASLLQHLAAMAKALPQPGIHGLFRLGMDRAFTLQGQGTVVTGTALSGSVAAGDLLTLAPQGEQVRVRSLRAQNRPTERARAGQRVALNITGVAKEDINRGDWLVAPELAECSERAEVQVQLLPQAPTLATWATIHVHLGAAHRTARIVPLQADQLNPGQAALAQLVFDSPVHATPGDRFIIRNAQASDTLGGGTVLDPFGAARKRRSPARLAWLNALATYTQERNIATLLQASPTGISQAMLVRLTQQSPEHWQLPPGTLDIAPGSTDALLILQAHLAPLKARVQAALQSFHDKEPDEAGPELWRLKRITAPEAGEPLWRGLITAMLDEGTVKQTGHSLHLPSHSTALTEEEQGSATRLLQALEAGRYAPPWVRDLATEFNTPEAEVRRLLRKLARTGQLSQVVTDLFYHPAPLAELAGIIATLPEAQAASFRDATGLGRKRAVQVLEFFDRVGYTRRVGNRHLVRPNVVWADSNQGATVQAIDRPVTPRPQAGEGRG